MRLEDLVTNYPLLYHMAAKGSWPSIRRHGLLSTSSLLDLFEVGGEERATLEERHRPTSVTVGHPRYGKAEIRDQKPMSDAGLRRALAPGLSPRDWYRMLNSKVFFWTSVQRLHRLLCAQAYRDDEHDVLIIDTAQVMKAHIHRVRLAPINTGVTRPFAWPRGRSTFSSVEAYDWEAWKRKRGVKEAVIEVAFEDGVPDVERFARLVKRMKQERDLSTIFRRA